MTAKETIAQQIGWFTELGVKELQLDKMHDIDFDSIGQLTNLKILSMADCSIGSLEGFPALIHLRELNLSQNNIKGGLQYLAGCPDLRILNLDYTKFGDVDEFRQLAEIMPNLKELLVYGCSELESEDLGSHLKAIWNFLPKLQKINNTSFRRRN